MGKKPKFLVHVHFAFFDKGSVLSTLKIGFMFGCVNVVFGSSLMELLRCFYGGHLLQINCQYQLQFGWYLNSVSVSKVKCLVFCEMCKCTSTYNFIQRKNQEP